MFRTFRLLIALIGCLHLCGGHLGVMQVIAWSKMLVDYSKADGLVEGAKKTFDGQHPCCMCKAIDQAKKQETESGKTPKAPLPVVDALAKSFISLDPVTVRAPLPTDAGVILALCPLVSDSARSEAPPIPPPRVA